MTLADTSLLDARHGDAVMTLDKDEEAEDGGDEVEEERIEILTHTQHHHAAEWTGVDPTHSFV